MRWFGKLARAVGTVVLAGIALGVVMVAGLFVAARFFYEPPAPQHAEQKADFLRSIPRIDPETAPNVVVILYDDLGSGDLSMQGNRLIRTPRIDSLAREGMRMTQFYSASPVCTPSRAALLSGRYPVRNGTNHHVFFAEESLAATLRKMLGWVNELPRDEILLPEVLAAAGYATGMVGKWPLGAVGGHQPMDFGFEEYLGVLNSNDEQPLHLYRGRAIEERDETERGWFGHADEDSGRVLRGVDQSRLTRRFTGEAIAFLERHRDDRFFLYLAYTAPHVPYYPDPDHAGRSAGGPYGDLVEDLDRGTGAVLDALEELGLAERTLVIVTSDNGPNYEGSAGPLRGRKQETYEGGMRVPMLVRWPGRIPAGASSDAMAMNIDFFPTLLSLVNAPLPSDRAIDGADLTSTWLEGAPSPHENLFYFPTIGSEPEAVRDARYEYRRKTGQQLRSKPHLSDLALDAEAHNLVKTHPDVAERLRTALDAMAQSVRDNPRGWRRAVATRRPRRCGGDSDGRGLYTRVRLRSPLPSDPPEQPPPRSPSLRRVNGCLHLRRQLRGHLGHAVIVRRVFHDLLEKLLLVRRARPEGTAFHDVSAGNVLTLRALVRRQRRSSCPGISGALLRCRGRTRVTGAGTPAGPKRFPAPGIEDSAGSSRDRKRSSMRTRDPNESLHVAGLWRYPVKSMAGEALSEASLGRHGIPGDRSIWVCGPEGVRTARRQHRLLGLAAAIDREGRPRVDGHPWDSPEALALTRAAAGDDAWLEEADEDERFDVLPLLVATDGAVAAFGRDVRRLRPNVLIGGVDGLGERRWPKAELHIGDAIVRLDSLRGRCPMTTVDPDTLERDPGVLLDIGRRFGGRLALNAEVLRPGRVRVGDPVRIEGA